jgi:hypothetical protein
MEPERRIEKWLRAFAKKRREQAGAPMELRPATRQHLQREIARQAEEKSRGGFFSGLFFGPRPRLVFAACFTALALCGWFLWRESTGTQPATLSMNKSSYPELGSLPAAPATPPPAVMSPTVANEDKKTVEEKRMPVPTTTAPTAPVAVSANRSLATPPAPPAETTKERDRAESTFQQKQLAITTSGTAAPTTNPSLAFKNEGAMDSLATADGPAKDVAGIFPTTPASTSTNLIADTINANANSQTLKTMSALQQVPTATRSTNTALFDLAKSPGAVTVSQAFRRLESSTTRGAMAASTPAPVLASFRVEQNGNDLKIIDADGSVYTGAIQIAQQEPASDYSFAAAKNGPVGAARAAKAASPAPQNYFFRVAGTNRNLNKNIIFSGNFVPFTNTQVVAGARGFGGIGGFGGGGGGGGGGRGAGGQVAEATDQAASQPVQAVLTNSRITGNVVIDDQKAIDVIATPTR